MNHMLRAIRLLTDTDIVVRRSLYLKKEEFVSKKKIFQKEMTFIFTESMNMIKYFLNRECAGSSYFICHDSIIEYPMINKSCTAYNK